MKIADTPLARNLHRRMEETGSTDMQRLSLQIGANSTYVRDILIGKVKSPGAPKLMELAKRLRTTPEELMDRGGALPAEPSDVVLTRAHTADSLVGNRDLPVFGSAQGGPDGEMIITFEPIEHVRRPAPLEGVHGGFGFYMVGESMSPVYEPGDMILCHPTRPPYAGQDVLVIRQHNGSQCALVKRLVRIDDHGLRLRQFTPPDDSLCVPREDVVSFHLVVGKYNRR